jgi:hypothetical protein
MLAQHPSWHVLAPSNLTRGYGHVHLLRDHALGQWICIDRHTGRILWQHHFDRPNFIRGIVDDDHVIIATELRPVGLMGQGGFDCYALDFRTGRLLWTTHPSNQCGDPAPEPYWYPDRYDHRGADVEPMVVEDGLCFYQDGRIVDAATGLQRDQISPEDVKLRATRQRADPATALYWSRSWRSPGIPVAPGRRLFQRKTSSGLALWLTDESGQRLWTFNLPEHGLEMPHPSFGAYRLAGQYVYIVATETLSQPPPRTPGAYEPTPRRFHLLTLELERGTICQDIPIASMPLATCQIEEVDKERLLLSSGVTKPPGNFGRNELRYFERCPRLTPS